MKYSCHLQLLHQPKLEIATDGTHISRSAKSKHTTTFHVGFVVTNVCPNVLDCIGAIDGTHVLARVPRNQRVAFLGRKHTTTQNILAVVDFDLRYTYVLAGWEGSAHDALTLLMPLREKMV
jgi:hypothetical protein